MAMEALQNYGKIHGSEGNNNNLLGLSLTLARLSSTNKFCVLELGMNHGGEIKKLTKIASPNITLITNISNSHIANFKNEEEIAEAKSEIFLGIKNQGIAIINTDEKWCDFITSKAKKANAKIHFFGSKSVCETKILKIENEINGTNVYFNNKVTWHLNNFNYLQAINAVSVIAILEVLNLDVNQGMRTISNLKPLPGRGDMLTISFKENNSNSIIIDDSYNATPSSMQMALKNYFRSKLQFPNLKSIIIIGDMLELGKYSEEMHQNLVPIINKIQPNLLITVGIETKKIITNLKINLKYCSYLEVEKLIIDLPKIIQPNQYILLKGSNATGLWKIVKFIKDINNFQEIDNVA
jgi:UDP-N-acetylmuramyl pentapeptide synthase